MKFVLHRNTENRNQKIPFPAMQVAGLADAEQLTMLCISARSHRAAEHTNNLLIALSLMRNVPARSIQLIAKTKVQENRRRKPTPLQFPSQTSPQYGPTFKRH